MGSGMVGGSILVWFRGGWLSQAIRTVFATAAFVALMTLLFGGPAGKHGLGPAISIRWPAALIFIASSMILVCIGRLPREKAKSGSRLEQEPSASLAILDLMRNMRDAQQNYSPEVLDLFLQILQDSSQYMTRAVEDVEVKDGCLNLHVVLEFALNDELVAEIRKSRRAVALLPLIKLAKGASLDNLRLYDEEGRHVSPLLQDEIYGLLAHVIDTLFRRAYIEAPGDTATRELTEVEKTVRGSLIQFVCNPESVSKEKIADIFRLLPSGEGIPSTVNTSAANYLTRICEFFAENYLIIAENELLRGGRISMKYLRSVPLYEQTATIGNRFRARFGLSPQSFTIPLSLPFEARSYHFSVSGVPGSFVADQKLMDGPSGSIVNQDTLESDNVRPYMDFSRNSALPYAHFHARGLQRLPAIDMWTRVKFEETPPGALGGAAIVSAACAILTWFFTVIQPGLRFDQQITTDLPALLLAVPAFAATWVGNSVDRLQRSSISTFIGLFVSTCVSVGSALLYIANANHKSFYMLGKINIFGAVTLTNVDAAWLLLALVASLMSAYLTEKLRDMVHNYMGLLGNDSSPKKLPGNHNGTTW